MKFTDKSGSVESERASSLPGPPLIVATIGLHGSASTWVFNVVRELLIDRFGEDRVMACYADQVAQIPKDEERAERHLVIKSHHGSVPLDDWLSSVGARVILSIRDPRDASISTAQRFEVPLSRATLWIQNDCHRLARVAPNAHLVLRYEDRFFDDRNTVFQLSRLLGFDVKGDTAAAIFTRYDTEAVRAFAGTLATLPAARLTKVGPFTMDRITQILGPHIGDARSNKWRELPEERQQSMTLRFKSFLEQMGYPAE
jgi:hypothetical protein